MDMNSPRMERIGVSKVQEFFSRCGWLFREQFVADYGVDAHVEIVQASKPTGQLLALQIKSGSWYFKEHPRQGIVFRFDDKHRDYWLKFSIPVLVVLYEPKLDKLYWQKVSSETILQTSNANEYKILIPDGNILDENCLHEFLELSNQPRHILKLNRLYMDRDWMQLINDGETVYIEFEDWINKSLPRYNIRIGCSSRDGIPEHVWPLIYGTGFENAISYAVPWADFETDEEAYEEYMRSEWSANYSSHYDEEDGKMWCSVSFEDWSKNKRPDGIVPVGSDGETESYRLILSLNEIGKAFLELDSFLNDESIYLEPPSQRQRGGS